MRGEFLHAVLKIIGEAASDGIDFINTRKRLRNFEPSMWESKEKVQKRFKQEQQLKLQKLIYKLKQDGLIDQHKLQEHILYKLTERGIAKFETLKKLLIKGSLPATIYQKEKATTFTIVLFDIPEKERRKRHWLRSVLKNLGFRLLQKSAWFGKIKIPQRLINDLDKLSLLRYVEILEISKTGTLKSKTL